MIDTKALRTKVIDLAIQGKLTDQLPEDGTAKELYQQFQEIKKVKPSTRESEEIDGPFDIPSSWKWIKLSDITTSQTLNDGDWVLSSDMVASGPVKLIQLGSIGELQYRNKGFKYLTEARYKELNGKRIHSGYLLINRIVADKMMVCIIPEIDGILITAVDACWIAPDSGSYDIRYLMYALSSTCVQNKVKELGHGVTRFRISKLNLINIDFPFPPLAEQHRIVAKIELIFSILDTIDTLQAQCHDNLTILKSKLIDAGIQGKLTEQRPEDGTAEELYQQIQNNNKVNKKTESAISGDDLPDIPDTWKWVYLGAISTILGGKRIPAGRQLTTEDTGHKYIRVSDMKNLSVDVNKLLYVPDDIYPAISRYIIRKEDVYITVAGTIGRVGKIPESIDGANLTENADRIVFSLLNQDWLIYCLFSSFVQKQIEYLTTQVAQPKLAIKRIQDFIIPLPPLAEQKRIVAKLEELLPLCEG